jgi:tetratricopeptide (TPR) repeat protein
LSRWGAHGVAEEAEIDIPEGAPSAGSELPLAAALDEAARDPALRPRLDAMFEAQTELLRDQRHHLSLQFKLEYRARFLDVWSKRLKLLLQAMTVAVGALAAFAVGAVAWDAHQDRALSIAPVDAPPDFAARGLTGRVLAGQLQDKLARMQRETVDLNAPAKVRADEERDIKVEMPEAGLSLAEVQSLLQQWLSRRIEVQASLSHPPEAPEGALVATVRAGEEPGGQLVQADGNVDAALQKAAEHVYADVYPARYAFWLDQHGRTEEAIPLLRRLSAEGTGESRSAALFRLQTIGVFDGPQKQALLREAVRLDPLNGLALDALGRTMPDSEQRLAFIKRGMDALEKRPIPTVAGLAPYMNYHRLLGETVDSFQGSCREMDVSPCTDEAFAEAFLTTGRTDNAVIATQSVIFPASVESIVSRHDTKIAGAMLAAPRPELEGRSDDFQTQAEIAWLAAEGAYDRQKEDWQGLATVLLRVKLMAQQPYLGQIQGQILQGSTLDDAHLGRFAEAEADVAQIGSTLDRSQVLQLHATIADLKGDHRSADAYWAQAIAAAPSYPQAETDWGRSLLKRGDADAAIARLKSASRKAPHFADPIELWGEALLAKGDFDGAAGRFAEAVKYAPHWGRLHLKWAEALARQGKADAARARKQAAAAEDLTPAERAELNGLRL